MTVDVDDNFFIGLISRKGIHKGIYKGTLATVLTSVWTRKFSFLLYNLTEINKTHYLTLWSSFQPITCFYIKFGDKGFFIKGR